MEYAGRGLVVLLGPTQAGTPGTAGPALILDLAVMQGSNAAEPGAKGSPAAAGVDVVVRGGRRMRPAGGEERSVG